MWPAARIEAINSEYPAVCNRCFGEIESCLHVFWTCPCNAHLNDELIRDTQHLIPKAIEGSKDEPCLWLRGFLRSKYIIIDSKYEASNEAHVSTADPNNHTDKWGSGLYHGDASGGKYTKYRTIRRCGVG